MNQIGRDIFRAIHEGKWLEIEYKNKENKRTRYWIGIKEMDIEKGILSVAGFHIMKQEIKRFDHIYI